MAAPRAGVVVGGGRAMSDGGGKSAADGRSGGARRTDPPAGGAHAARGGNGAPEDQPGASRRSRAIPAVHAAANGDAGEFVPARAGGMESEAWRGARFNRAHDSRDAPADCGAEPGGFGAVGPGSRAEAVGKPFPPPESDPGQAGGGEVGTAAAGHRDYRIQISARMF